MMSLFVVAAVAGAASGDCPMRPPALGAARIRASADVKALVVDASRLSATALLKNGSALRVVNMGCQHAGAYARLWLCSVRLDADSVAKVADKVAALAFGDENKGFHRWLESQRLKMGADGMVSAQGTGEGSITYILETEPQDLGLWSWLTISYAYP